MPQSILDTLAAAVASDIEANRGTFTALADFDVRRVSVVEFDTEELTKPLVAIHGADERRTPLNRRETQREWDIHLSLIARLTDESNETLDLHRLFVQQLADFWEYRQPTGIENQRWAAIEVIPYIPEIVKELKFVGVVSLTYKGVKP